MSDQPPVPDTGDGSDRRSTSGTSRWQKVVGIIGLVVLVGVGVRMFGAVGGAAGHDPGGNAPAEAPEDGDQTPPDDGGHTPPFDH